MEEFPDDEQRYHIDRFEHELKQPPAITAAAANFTGTFEGFPVEWVEEPLFRGTVTKMFSEPMHRNGIDYQIYVSTLRQQNKTVIVAAGNFGFAQLSEAVVTRYGDGDFEAGLVKAAKELTKFSQEDIRAEAFKQHPILALEYQNFLDNRAELSKYLQ